MLAVWNQTVFRYCMRVLIADDDVTRTAFSAKSILATIPSFAHNGSEAWDLIYTEDAVSGDTRLADGGRRRA